MLREIHDLIFGQNGYEKTKIDERYHEAIKKTTSINLTSLEEFELLESIIYKIREELRLPSSSLNRCIKDKQKPLTKKQVDELITALEEKRYAFLRYAFQIIHPQQEQPSTQETPTHSQEDKSSYQETGKSAEPEEPEQREVSSVEVFHDKRADVYCCNGAVPYLLVRFHQDPDFVMLKHLVMAFFDLYLPEGTNIISEGDRYLIIPRYQQDNLIQLPQQPGTELDELAARLKATAHGPEEKEPPEEQKSKPSNSSEDGYVSISADADTEDHIKTKKAEEDSLDQLLSSYNQQEAPNLSKRASDGEEEAIRMQRDEEEMPKKEPKEETPETTVLTETSTEETPKVEKTEESPTHPQEERPAAKKTEKPSTTQEEKHDDPYLIYTDEEITIRFNPASKITGELLLSPANAQQLGSASEQTWAYLMIFAKFFASALFEITQAHGTNIYWNAKETQVHIVPRYQQDNLPLTWSPKTQSDEFLEQVKAQLLAVLTGELQPSNQQQPDQPAANAQKQQEETAAPADDQAKYRNDYAEKVSREKAEYILRSLDRLP